jgi:hypothetical protein
MKNILEIIFYTNSEISPGKKKKKKKKKKNTLDLIDPMIIKNHLQLKSVPSGHFELVLLLNQSFYHLPLIG